MTRRPLRPAGTAPIPTASDIKSVSYQVWVTPEQRDSITKAWERSGLTWPDWTARAVERLMRETTEEVASLLTSWSPDREGKELLSFRIRSNTLQDAKDLAANHGGTVQAVFAHAHFMQSLAIPNAS